MNAHIALQQFENALSVMADHAALQARADYLTRTLSAFSSFEDLITADGNYRPSLSRATPETRELGALYDAAQQARGDDRRAFMYGGVALKGSLLDPANYDKDESWYRAGDRIAWYDRRIKHWTTYTVSPEGHQLGGAEYYKRVRDLLSAVHCHQ